EAWAEDGAALLDAVGLDRVYVHGTSMGGMIAIAFTAKFPERTIAACADVAFAKPDVYRQTVFRVWRRMAEAMPWDDFSDHVTTQAVGAARGAWRAGRARGSSSSSATSSASTTRTRSARPAWRWRTWTSRRSSHRSRGRC